MTPLTARQREVIELRAQGMSAKRVAAALNISVSAVWVAQHRGWKKIGVDNVVGATLTIRNLIEGGTTGHST